MVEEKFITDIDIYNESDGELNKEKIACIDKEKIQFAYDNAVGYLKEIDNGMKIISNKANLLISYLATCIAGLIAFLLQNNLDNSLGLSFASFTLLFFLIIVFFVAFHFINPSYKASLYNEPKNILNKNMFEYCLKGIMIFEIELLQENINQNLKAQTRKAIILRQCIFLTFAAPILSFVISFFLNFPAIANFCVTFVNNIS